MKTILSLPSSLVHAVACLLLASGSTHLSAQTDDFNDGNDTGWTRYTPLAPFGTGGSFSFPSGAYRITTPASPNPEILGPARTGSLFPATAFRRVQVEVDLFGWDNTLTQSLGLVFRAADLGLGTTTGYTYNYNVVSGFHQINLVLNEAAARVVNESAYRLNPNHRYRMVLDAVENRFLGRIYSSTNATTPIHSLFGTDDTHASGRSGVFVFAIDPLSRLDARFDNYSTSVPGTIRATFLDAAPAAGESPTEPIPSVTVRLAHVETTIQPETIRLTVDGQEVSFESFELDSILTLTHTPGADLDPTRPHTASVRFQDGQGEQAFSWNFGAPAPAMAATLLSTASLQDPFKPESGATLNAAAKRFTVPVSGSQRFYRVLDASARTLKLVSVSGNTVTIDFE